MDQPSSSKNIESPCTTENQSNNENDQTETNRLVIAKSVKELAAFKQVQTADIFKMRDGFFIVCFEELFECLLRKDVIAVATTCKYLSQVARLYFQNYSSTSVDFDSGEVRCFPQFITHLRIQKQDFKKFANIQTKFIRLKFLDLECGKRTCSEFAVRNFEETLSKLEYLSMEWYEFNACSLRSLISSCPKIKHLCYNEEEFNYYRCSSEQNWPIVKCPNLEHLQLRVEFFTSNHVKDFIEFNPTIQKLTISPYFNQICGILYPLNHSEIVLTDLVILMDDDPETDDFLDFLNLLLELFHNGHFKRLHWKYLPGYDDESAPINQMLFKLFISGAIVGNGVAIPTIQSFNNLEELCVTSYADRNSYEDIVANLTRLKRVHLQSASSDVVYLFISKTESLKEIKLKKLRGGLHFNEDDKIINLNALNNAREKLAKGRDLKVEIYVEEEIYVATKWARKGDTTCGLIELKRTDPSEWEQDVW